MLKRLFDILVSGVILVAASPILIVAMVATKIVSPGPVLYLAKRAGRGGVKYRMYKIRTMHTAADSGPAITALGDKRIFPLGYWVRKLKIDEIPQFLNVLIGNMSIVGPRPEDPGIVEAYYTDWMMKTLDVRPGITSPGAIFGYLEGDAYLEGDDIEQAYANKLLPKKLQIELDYLEKATFLGDLKIIFLTVWSIVTTMFKKES